MSAAGMIAIVLAGIVAAIIMITTGMITIVLASIMTAIPKPMPAKRDL